MAERRLRRALLPALAALLAACGAASTHGREPMELASFPRSQIEVRTARATHRFDVWIADTPARQAQGLMFVRDLPASQGMLFVHREPRVVGMWMKNTYIPLDMLFVAADGRIVSIARETRPHSLETISSGVPVKGVVEIRGGEADRLGIRVGDRVVHGAFSAKASPAPAGL